jgi:ADP-ribose pyrophosphatase YjhB (NUDIX family)
MNFLSHLFATDTGILVLAFLCALIAVPVGYKTSNKARLWIVGVMFATAAVTFALMLPGVIPHSVYIVPLGVALGIVLGRDFAEESYTYKDKAAEFEELRKEAARLAEKAAELAALEELRKKRPAFNYCPNCTAPLAERDFSGKLKLACPRCTFVHWDNPKVVAVVLVPSADGTGLLLIKRSIPPRIGFYALPGGYVDTNEGFEEGSIREVKEETGLDVTIDRPFWSVAIKGKNEILTFYVATVTGGTISVSEETSEVAFFSLDKIPEEIAFPTHRQAIDMWIASRKAA